MQAAFDLAGQSAFKDKINSLLDGVKLRDLNAKAFGGKIWDAIKSLFDNIDLSGMTEDEFVAKVDQLYDQYVGQMIKGINPIFGPMLDGIVNQVVLNQARKFYRNHSTPQPA